jgi:dihydropteroate synthase
MSSDWIALAFPDVNRSLTCRILMLITNSQLSDSQLSDPQFSELTAIDHELSNRFIALDPSGYFVIYLDREAKLICAKHYSNVIDDQGVACDPETGLPLPCSPKLERQPTAIFTGRTAKELCVQIFEATQPCPLSYLDHAAYLGREFVRAEIALLSGQDYLQD